MNIITTTEVIKDILDLYSDQQANLSSEILRSQLADEISRALRLNDLVKKRTDTELDSNYPLRYR